VKLTEVRRFALGLAEVTEEPHHDYSSFRVRGKIFVTVPPTEERIHVFVDESAREQAIGMYPAWAEKLLWGGKVVGLKVSLASAPPAAVQELVSAAWLFKAPSTLARGTSKFSKPVQPTGSRARKGAE
jgi:hypothetical protein